eukprot:TRINITY_DN8658_c0_g1_i1.p1 TRINITY_DN8658_c0_g1~~TRINITY_DN8658_c0_g1_i1.p1  ORF type:complete len:856 (-),score=229.96 TRINITY_DN8658_c0_g1_i1:63-2564(-)
MCIRDSFKVDVNSIHTQNNKIHFSLLGDNSTHPIDCRISCFREGIFRFFVRNPAHTSGWNFECVNKFELEDLPHDLIKMEKHPEKVVIHVQSKDLLEKAKENSYQIEIFTNDFKVNVLHNNYHLASINSNNFLNYTTNPGVDLTFDSHYLYGIPEHCDTHLLADTKAGKPYRLYNVDNYLYPLYERGGLYGSIPILLSHNTKGTISMFWVNTSETYIDIHKDKTHGKAHTFWCSEFGDMDFFLVMGSSVSSIFYKNSVITGFTPLPQYFSLGYGQCRYSYKTQQECLDVDESFNQYDIPYDYLALDIDHTDGMRYFTFHPTNYPDPVALQKHLENQGRKVVTIIDPHVKEDKDYYVYDEGVKDDIFVKDKDGDIWIAKCWPQESAWIDFINEEARDRWATYFDYDKYKYSTPSLYAWNDMNEPAVFNQREDLSMPKDNIHYYKKDGKRYPVSHGEIHNAYGFCQTIGTYLGLLRRNKEKNDRPFVLTRSFFTSVQKYSTVWTADCISSWEYLKANTSMLLSISVTGVSLCGADIPGFEGNPQENLFVRWFQLGMWYPFCRGHASMYVMSKEPWTMGERSRKIVRENIITRYTLLPYMYSQLYHHNKTGFPFMRPLWTTYPHIEDCFKEEIKFMMGDSIIVSPCVHLSESKYRIEEYLTSTRLYDFYDHVEIPGEMEREHKLERIGVFFKGGHIIPTFLFKKSIKSSVDARQHPLNLVVTLDKNNKSFGYLFYDDGKSFDYAKDVYMLVEFYFQNGQLRFEVLHHGLKDELSVNIDRVTILGWKDKVNSVQLQETKAGEGKNLTFDQKLSDNLNVITIDKLSLEVKENLTISLR